MSGIGKPVRLPIPARERPYMAFNRHLSHDDASKPEAVPIDPAQRVVSETIDRLARVAEDLAQAQVDVMAHLPDSVRLALAHRLLTAAEKTQAAMITFRVYERFGTLQPAKSGKPKKKPRPKM